MSSDAITLEYRDKVAIITLNQPKKLNALNADQYYHIATLLNQIATRDDVYITVLAGTGRFFSA
jgi:Delta3-Delta2-enoyl-CoA isomerase